MGDIRQEMEDNTEKDRQASPLVDTGNEDAEGHMRVQATDEAEATDDVEGHRLHRSPKATDDSDEDDTEGHIARRP